MEDKKQEGRKIIEDFINQAGSSARFSDEDIVGIFTPLLLQLERLHAEDKVALSKGMDSFTVSDTGSLRLLEKDCPETWTNFSALNKVLPQLHHSLDIVSEQQVTTDVSNREFSMDDQQAPEEIPEKILAPIFVSGYRSYEDVLGHHDPLTDIQILGFFIASLTIGLDLREQNATRTLLSVVRNPAYISQRVHPNIIGLIMDMVQLDRRLRIRDAYTARIRLENYNEYNTVGQESFEDILTRYNEDEGNRNSWILSKLRNRLFDLSKRNRLIYFKKSSRSVNLTLSSVPNVLDYKNIRPEKLFIWNDEISSDIRSAKAIKLSKYLRVKDNPQIVTSLKKVYYEANRDIAEFGFDQLKMAICFLNWYNYKENTNEKIHSPLLLIPVGLKKKKGISDEFTLTIQDTVANVNPVLAYYLKELYDIRLPNSFDLATTTIEEVYDNIRKIVALKSNEVQLSLIKKPRIRLIHSLAKRSYESFQKKVQMVLNKAIWGNSDDYSYAANDFRPLGLKLFHERLREKASILEFLVDENVTLEQKVVESTVKRELFQLEMDGSINPYKWEFDLCNFTLGNFNYKRMTLVNDYDFLLDQSIDNGIFTALFSNDPRKEFAPEKGGMKLQDNFSVIPTDPTQLSAIQKAKEGRSYIIQGPPGTGKSQTIVNLLANTVAQGKSILFISEKRAALDVVHARMTQSGLRDICTMIHDSQADKKDFIFDLKDTYEKYSKEANQLEQTNQRRDAVIRKIEELLDRLYSFYNYQGSGEGDLQIRKVVDHLLSMGFSRRDFNSSHFNNAPDYVSFREDVKLLKSLTDAIITNTKYKSIANCPFLKIDGQFINGHNTDQIARYCDNIENNLSKLTSSLNAHFGINVKNINDLESVFESCLHIEHLYIEGHSELLDPGGSHAIQFDQLEATLIKDNERLLILKNKNKHWLRKPTSDELKRLFKTYKEASSGLFNRLTGKKDKFKEMLTTYYDFSAMMIAPDIDEILSDVKEELDLRESIKQKRKESDFGQSLTSEMVLKARASCVKLEELAGVRDMHTHVQFQEFFKNNVWNTVYHEFIKSKNAIMPSFVGEIEEVYDIVDDLKISIPSLYVLAPRLDEWFNFPDKTRDYLINSGLSLDQITFTSAYNYLIEKSVGPGATTTGAEIQLIVDEIGDLYFEFLSINSQWVQEKMKKKFQNALDLSFIPAYELTKEQKQLKDSYYQGRTILENEFSKKIRYKSIRELADGDTGIILKDLKPIWMMSPLSVSDTLPLQSMFDIVVFDEASQITVEEGVPPLFRAEQAIIVGDEMQMPPTNFFSTRIDDSEEEAEFLSMDAESLLNQGARKLPQVTLGWHYRSKKEALINFSNFAFYRGALLTIPDVAKYDMEDLSLEVFDKTDASKLVDEIFKRSISYHYLPNGVYVNRMNEQEAEYIAHLVRELLMGPNNESIGIVAFSMQQQNNIEMALSRLADTDTNFSVALEEAFSVSQGEDFTGLFVRNLENVQGDERDIMILSICYGYNLKGKMLMNFGPINRRGGEKRLNVIFSRSKKHMVVVSSIQYGDIKNEYNEGANYLRKYLQYAELVSKGDDDAAMSILSTLSRRGSQLNVGQTIDPLVDQIKKSLEGQYHVDTYLGQSKLKVHLGIKKDAHQDHYDLGILIDPIKSYETKGLLNQYYKVPSILNAFGWRIFRVFALDWIKNKNIIIQNIIDIIEKTDKVMSQNIELIEEESVHNKVEEMTEVALRHVVKAKFWKIKRMGQVVTIIMGDFGTDGVETVKHLDHEEAAKIYFDEQTANRRRRGFEEV